MTAGPLGPAVVFSGAGPAAPGPKGAGVDDVDATLADLERRLRALQAELDHPAAAPAPAPAPGAAPAGDPLEAFGEQLRRTTSDLVGAFERTVREVHGGEEAVFDDQVALDARAGLPELCALASALTGIDGVHAVELRAYAGGHAALDLALDRPVALVAELRRRGGPPFGVVASRPGRLAIEVGTHAGGVAD